MVVCSCGGAVRRREPSAGAFALHKTSLRFHAKSTESFFIGMHKQDVLRSVSLGNVVAVFVLVGVLVHTLRVKRAHTEEAERVITLIKSVDSFLIVLSSLSAILARVPRLTAAVPPTVVEAIVVSLSGVALVMLFLIDPWYASRVLGVENPGSVFWSINFSDTRTALGLSGLVFGCHIMLPVRWFVLVPLQVLAVLTYAVYAFVVGGPDGTGAWSTLLLIIGLVVIAGIGRRTIELHQREALCQLIRERNLRVDTEFRLSQLSGHDREACELSGRQEAEHASVVESSRPETTESAKAFEDSTLEEVLKIGRREQWYIDRSELRLHPEILGQGNYGRVSAGDFHGTPVAVKTGIAKEETERGREKAILDQLNELRVLRRLRHPGIVLFHGATMDETGHGLSLVLELVKGVTLQDAVLADGEQALGPQDTLRLLLEICRALGYLHSRHPAVVHGDLKPSNVLAEAAPGSPGFTHAKLLDFGLSRVLTRHARPLGGSLAWAAPEVVQGCAPQLASDIFSFGRLVFFCTTGCLPHRGKSRTNMMRILSQGRVPQLPWPKDASSQAVSCRALVEACCGPDPRVRPTAAGAQQQLEAVGGAGTGPGPEGSSGGAPEEACSRAPPAEEGAAGQEEEEAEKEKEVLAEPRFAATPKKTTLMYVTAMLSRTNFKVLRQEECCIYHAAVRNLAKIVLPLEASSCRGSPLQNVVAQCPSCRLLLDPTADADSTDFVGRRNKLRCFFCETSVEFPALQSL